MKNTERKRENPGDDEVVSDEILEASGFPKNFHLTHGELRRHNESTERRRILEKNSGEKARASLAKEMKKIKPEDIEAAQRAGQTREETEK